MFRKWITALFNTILPRHPRAERAVRLTPEKLVTLFAPTTLKGASWIHALFPYRDERVRSLVQAVKYYGERTVADKVAPFAADYLTELVAEARAFSGWEDVVLAPIPSSPQRMRERGYNQAALFARGVAARMPDVTYDETLLSREDRTSQVHVLRMLRKSNMQGAFTADSRAKDRFVILIDDVTESGATLSDARRALLSSGARDVIALAVAH
jgi:predicted amidophosphoribosyltransferase